MNLRGSWRNIGDPAEGALVVAAAKAAGLFEKDLLQKMPRAKEAPFDSDRRHVTTFHPIIVGM